MNEQLLHDKDTFASILNAVRDIAVDHVSGGIESLAPGRFIAPLPKAILSEKGPGALKVLDTFKEQYAPLMANTAGPRYFGFVTGGSTPASVAGDWLVSTFDQNACGSNDSVAPVLEHQTIDLFRQLIGIDSNYFGSFVTGATVSNMVSLAIGRQWVGEQMGQDIASDGMTSPIKILSGTPHSSVLKSMAMLGIGRKNLVYVPTLASREAVDVALLATALEQHGPCIVVANAGTVNTVDFDDLQAIASLKQKHSFWLHVDAAFGGFAGVSPRYRDLINGINAADSITIDAHKWLNVPYDAAMQFTRRKDLQLKVFQNAAAYLSDPEQSPDFFHYTPENSRRFRALPTWFSLQAYGREGHREIVERNCDLALALGKWIEESNAYQLLAPVRMNVVCFAPKKEGNTMDSIRQFLGKVRDDGRVFFTPTLYKGQAGIRAAISNWMTTREDIDTAVTVLKELAKNI